MCCSRLSVIRRRHSAVADELIEALDNLVATFCAAAARHDDLSGGGFGASTRLTSSTARRGPRQVCCSFDGNMRCPWFLGFVLRSPLSPSELSPSCRALFFSTCFSLNVCGFFLLFRLAHASVPVPWTSLAITVRRVRDLTFLALEFAARIFSIGVRSSPFFFFEKLEGGCSPTFWCETWSLASCRNRKKPAGGRCGGHHGAPYLCRASARGAPLQNASHRMERTYLECKFVVVAALGRRHLVL